MQLDSDKRAYKGKQGYLRIFIRRGNGLYQRKSSVRELIITNIEELREAVKPFYTTDKRYRHVLGAEEEITRLCGIFSLDEKTTLSLRKAALLHDITKAYDYDANIKYMESIGRTFPKHNLHCVKTLHQVSGAYMAREKFPLDTDDIAFSAIMYHTTGRPGMTITEKLLYLADYIEPQRTFYDCVELRNYFYDGINRGEAPEKHLKSTLLISYDMTIRGIIKGSGYLHPDTIAARNELVLDVAADKAAQ